jgi:hypothetical protein
VAGADGEGVHFEGSGARGRAACLCEGGVAGMACVADLARAGGDAMVGSDDASSGDAGSVGRAGESGRGESGLDSGSADCVERGQTGDGMVGTCGDGDAVNGGVAELDNGERSSLLSSSRSWRSSASLLRFLVFFAGGGRISGEEGSTGLGAGCVIVAEDRSTPTGAAATEEGDSVGASHAAVAARPRRRRQRRRCFPAVVAVAAGTGRLQETVMA